METKYLHLKKTKTYICGGKPTPNRYIYINIRQTNQGTMGP